MNARGRLVLLLMVATLQGVAGPRAQTSSDTTVVDPSRRDTSAGVAPGSNPSERLDARTFRYIYRQDSPAFVGTMRAVNSASVPLFLAALPVSGAVALSDSDIDPTVRLGASTAGAVGVVYIIKSIVRRQRPYDALDGVEARVDVPGPEADPDPFSLPSGHAAAAFALATSTTLSYPRWYVAAPAYAWASATALARVWHGVHFPSDVVLGAVIGAGAAAVVHVLLPEVDPEDVDSAAGPPPAITVVLPL
jgi:hypothetical protein